MEYSNNEHRNTRNTGSLGTGGTGGGATAPGNGTTNTGGGGGSGPVGQGGSGIVVVHEPATPFSLIRGIWNIQGQYVQKKAGTWT